ncbi:MAG: VanW family protein [Eubacteriales bacterium]|nr:VanW family protein [Eubacteriales bacterium]
MTKKILSFLIFLALILSTLPTLAKDEVLYNAQITMNYPNSYTNVYLKANKNSKVIGKLYAGNPVQIVEVLPDYLGIAYGKGKGYVIRGRVDEVKRIDLKNLPPYGVNQIKYYTTFWQDTPIHSEPNANSETLITMHPGAMVGFIDVVDGWAYLVYKRQYGYVDTRYLRSLDRVAPEVSLGDNNTPIAAFNSFYNIADTELNLNRIENLKLGAKRMSVILQPGQKLDFNNEVGPFTIGNGYLEAGALVDGKWGTASGGGSCQISSTMYNAVLQLTGLTVLVRAPHGANGASYLPHGMDATSGGLNFVFRNDYAFPIQIKTHVQDGSLFVAIYKA